MLVNKTNSAIIKTALLVGYIVIKDENEEKMEELYNDIQAFVEGHPEHPSTATIQQILETLFPEENSTEE